MMMALRQSPTEQFLFRALDGSRPRHGLSRAAIIAIAASAAAHLGLIGYLATQHFSFQDQVVADHAIRITAITLTPPKPTTPPSPTQQRRPSLTRQTVEWTAAPVTHPVLTSQTPLQAVDLKPGWVAQDVTLGPLPDQGPARVIVDPTWLNRPSAAELSRFYPERDIDLGLAGRASLTCSVAASGRLGGCQVVAETPARAQFGAAALKLVPYFRMSPRTVDGQPTDCGTVKFDIVFNLTDVG